jgi:hypothetical protein
LVREIFKSLRNRFIIPPKITAKGHNQPHHKIFGIEKVNNCRQSTFTALHFSDIRALMRGLFSNPTIGILDTYGEAEIWMWLLLRF